MSKVLVTGQTINVWALRQVIKSKINLNFIVFRDFLEKLIGVTWLITIKMASSCFKYMVITMLIYTDAGAFYFV